MPSLLPGYEYDVFISYRQNDNRSGWVTQFVQDLREELAATIKEDISIYFDENPHDGLQDTHHVNKSLEGKLKCLVFIPIVSHTYCDPKSFAWNHEFLPFCNWAKEDSRGIDIRILNGNVASRILPIQIHDLDAKDKELFEEITGSVLRSIDFIFRSMGVNRPLTNQDTRVENLGKTIYRDQINKTANALEGLIHAMAYSATTPQPDTRQHEVSNTPGRADSFWGELKRRNVFRAGVTYFIVSLLLLQALAVITPTLRLEESTIRIVMGCLVAGFPVALWLAWRYESSPQGFIRTTSEASASNPYSSGQKKPLTSMPMVFVLIFSLALLAVYIKLFLAPVHEGGLVSIAVLPFENRTGNSSDRYIADGITDDIINRLTGTGKLIVRSRTATKQFTSQVTVYREIIGALEVRFIVKGSIQRDGDQILVTAQLLDSEGSYLWGDTFKHTSANLIAIQSEIAQRIVTNLKIKLSELQSSELAKPATDNGTAYDYFLRGRDHYYKYSRDANDSAIAEFKKAVQLDPAYTRAWAGLGDAFAQMHGRFAREYSWTDSALAAGQRAIELDSLLAEGYKAKAVAFSYRKEYKKAIPLLLKAVQLSPTYVQAVGNLGTNYFSTRDLPNALKWELTSAGLDPTNWIPYQIIGWTYRLLGDLQEAESWLTKSLEKRNGKRYDTYEHLAYTYVAQGRKQQAMRLIDELLKDNENDTRVLETAGLIAHFAGDADAAERYFIESIKRNPAYKDDRNSYSPIGLGQILLSKGNKVEAEVYLTQATFNLNTELENGSQSADLPYYIASISAIRGKADEATAWLEKAMARGWTDHAMLEYGPYFAGIRSDAKVQSIISQLKEESRRMRAKITTAK